MISCVIIDDDPKIREVFCELLTLIGVTVLATGKDGKDATGKETDSTAREKECQEKGNGSVSPA